ncbi:undecaprenyl-diphosphate phosphatase [Kribbella sp.]|uniref:undecaprenyl-diphosphate phosphatase n=1 Tax=Kribbella sp. TaxID=1871183 RepID=UPI002D488317|nr:undecaprenyl-diphosphate phosphatase [Kribbella sp.]HZX08657.1 undecaprenyl-diphosphate phosphatase [Kribbella sp.]
MNWFSAVVLGLVQGLTEFLPVSSSAHQRIVAALAGWPDPGAAFTAVTQLGTEAAVLIYFRRDIARIIVSWSKSLIDRDRRSDPDAKLGWYVIIGTIPIAVLGLVLQNPIETAFRDLRLVAAALIGFGIVLGIADRIAADDRPLTRLTTGNAIVYGFAQALALIPGVSRSGGTITAGLLMGYRREAAARYSFLLAIPAVLASGLLELTKIGNAGDNPAWGPTLLATAIAFIVGYAAIAWFLRYIATHRFTTFVIYRIALGAAVLALTGTGVLAN